MSHSERRCNTVYSDTARKSVRPRRRIRSQIRDDQNDPIDGPMLIEGRRRHAALQEDPEYIVARDEERAAYEAELAENTRSTIEAHQKTVPPGEAQAKRTRCAIARQSKRRSAAWEKRRTYTFGYKLYASEFLSERVMQHVSSAEWKVLWFVFMRTVWWLSKKNEIDLRTMEKGKRWIDKKGYPCGYDGTGLSNKTLRNATASLVEKGLLIRSRRYEWQKYTYEIPRLDLIPELTCFDGVDLAFSAPFTIEKGVSEIVRIG